MKRGKTNKKAQAQIITTVLIILLVLAATVIVWQVVNSSVRGGAGEIEERTTCLGINLEIKDISSAVTVRRNVGGPNEDIGILVLRNGARVETITGIGVLEEGTTSAISGITSGDIIEAAPVVNNIPCDVVDKKIVP